MIDTKRREWSDSYFHGQDARYFYIKGNVKECLKSMSKAEITWKNIGMLLTVWIGPIRRWVVKNKNIMNSND